MKCCSCFQDSGTGQSRTAETFAGSVFMLPWAIIYSTKGTKGKWNLHFSAYTNKVFQMPLQHCSHMLGVLLLQLREDLDIIQVHEHKTIQQWFTRA